MSIIAEVCGPQGSNVAALQKDGKTDRIAHYAARCCHRKNGPRARRGANGRTVKLAARTTGEANWRRCRGEASRLPGPDISRLKKSPCGSSHCNVVRDQQLNRDRVDTLKSMPFDAAF